MAIQFLTPIDQEGLDPTGKNRQTIMRFHVNKQTYSPKSPLCYLSGSEYLNKYCDRLTSSFSDRTNPHYEYVQWNLSYREKYGPQGGVFPIKYLYESYDRSYSNALTSKEFKYAKLGSRWLARYVHQLRDRYGLPNYAVTPTVGTNAAIPTGCKKGTFYAETVGFGPHRHILPNLPGQRYMRKKKRAINQDACANVRLTETMLSNVRQFLRAHLPEFFGSWLNPQDVVQPCATFIVDNNYYSVETDYEKMDEHFGIEITTEIVMPIYEQLLTPGEFMQLQIVVAELFDQPIYFGTFMRTGRHNLLSGQNPTNDFETIAQVCQAIGILLCMNLDPCSIKQLHLGDDMVVAFKTLKQARLFMHLFVEESERNGLAINKEKSTIRHGSVQYCRKFYYKRGIRYIASDGSSVLYGAYPSLLALNSIVNPERFTSGASALGICSCATYQRLDNCIGSPDFVLLCQFIGKYTTLLDHDDQITPEAVELYNFTDWWFKVYGEKWNPTVSPAFRALHRA